MRKRKKSKEGITKEDILFLIEKYEELDPKPYKVILTTRDYLGVQIKWVDTYISKNDWFSKLEKENRLKLMKEFIELNIYRCKALLYTLYSDVTDIEKWEFLLSKERYELEVNDDEHSLKNLNMRILQIKKLFRKLKKKNIRSE